MTIKDVINKVVNDHQGINTIDHALEVSRQVSEMDDFEKSLMELIEEGEIVELEYTLPSMDYRVKNLYLPKNTMIQVSRKAS